MNPTVINKRRRFTGLQFVLPYKQMDGKTQFFVLDHLPTPTALRRRGVLTLPVKTVLIDPMVQVSLFFDLPLLVQGHQQNLGLLIRQYDMTTVPD